MGKSLLFGAVMCAILLVAATTRSDVAATDNAVDDTASLPEPITGTPVEPAPGENTPQKNPFAPYDVGPPESIVPYASLTPEEQVVVDRGRDANGWQQTHDGFATAVRERSTKSRAEAAQHLLGLDSIGSIGVLP